MYRRYATHTGCTLTVTLTQGLGSSMHLATVHLATAMQHDRVFLWAPNTNRTPILEDRKWWRPFIDPHLQHYNEIVRPCSSMAAC